MKCIEMSICCHRICRHFLDFHHLPFVEHLRCGIDSTQKEHAGQTMLPWLMCWFVQP
jgi:hypothetical protein